MPHASAVWENRFANERRLLVLFLWATVIPPGLFALEDALAGRDLGNALIRAAPAIVAAAALLALPWTRPDIPVRTWSHWVTLLLAVTLLISSAARPESELAPLRGRMLGPALVYLLAPNTMLRQAGPAILLSAGHAILRAARLDPFEALPFANDVTYLVVINAAGILRIRSRHTLERSLDEAWAREKDARLAAERARAEVQTLEGIIPICMHCRKLRSDAGQWQRLELYVREKTGAAFSHGVCPECLETHYPEATP